MTMNNEHSSENLPSLRINARRVLSGSIYLFLLIGSGCGGQLYKVAPIPADAPVSDVSAGLSVGATALDGDRSLEQFEANLPMAGIIAVDVRVINNSSNPISLRPLKFDLSDDSRSKLKLLAPKKALSKVMKFYGNNFYPLEAKRATLENFEAIGLKPGGSLDSKAELRGFIFFEIKKGTNIGNLTLNVAGTGAPVSISLNAR